MVFILDALRNGLYAFVKQLLEQYAEHVSWQSEIRHEAIKFPPMEKMIIDYQVRSNSITGHTLFWLMPSPNGRWSAVLADLWGTWATRVALERQVLVQLPSKLDEWVTFVSCIAYPLLAKHRIRLRLYSGCLSSMVWSCFGLVFGAKLAVSVSAVVANFIRIRRRRTKSLRFSVT